MSPSTWRFILFGGLGMLGEVLFTSIQTVVKARKWRLDGTTYLWMFPIYGLISLCFPPLYWTIEAFPWFVRGVIYTLFIFVVEYIAGTLLTRLTGDHIWHYRDKLNFKGQITFAYTPVWFIVGLLVERFFPTIDRLSRLLSKAQIP